MGLTFPLNPVDNLKFDANGNVLANINAQNINPNVNNVAGSVAGSVGSVTGAVGSITNPPLRHKFMTNLITTTTSTTQVTLGTYTSSNGIGIVFANIGNTVVNNSTYFSLYNGSTQLGSVSSDNPNVMYSSYSLAYAPQGAVTLSLEGYVSGNTGQYDISVYEVF